MLPPSHRLKLPTHWNKNFPDFQVRNEYFKLLVKKADSTSATKIGFVISAKVGKATFRNQIRRALVRLIREQLKELTPGLEVVWIVYPTVEKASNEEFNAAVNKILSKISVAGPRLG